MLPLTYDTHKSLLRIAGSTIIERLVTSLLDVGVADIVVVTGYRADEVEAHLTERFPDVPIRFVRNELFEQTNNVVSMALAFEHGDLDDDLLLIESDLLCDPAAIRRVVESHEPDVALVDRYRPGMDGTVVTIRDGVVTEVIPPHRQRGDFSFADKYKTLNIYKFSRDFCEKTFRPLVTYYASAIDDSSYYELVLGILIYVGKAAIAAEIVDDLKWVEVDDPTDLRVAQFVFDPASRRSSLEDAKGGYWKFDLLDFAYLRNMYFPTESMHAEMRAALPSLLENYGSSQRVLDEKLAYVLKCGAERVTLVNGASQAIRWLGTKLRGRPALLPRPTFLEWSAAFTGAITYIDDGAPDPVALAPHAADCDVVLFVNPNNPTGTWIDVQAIHGFASVHRDKVVIVDESFQGYTGRPSLMSLLEKEPLSNVIVVSSLSKSLGVPGARLGYVYSCNSDWRSELEEWLPIWNINSVAEHFLELVLKHRESLDLAYARTAADRDGFATSLAMTDVVDRVWPSAANFLLVRLRMDAVGAAHLVEDLLERESIYVKDVSKRMGDGAGWFRLAVRVPAENARLCSVLLSLSQTKN